VVRFQHHVVRRYSLDICNLISKHGMFDFKAWLLIRFMSLLFPFMLSNRTKISENVSASNESDTPIQQLVNA